SEDFKVVSNIPFALTSSIMQKLMYDSIDSFKGGCLILQKESAYKYSAKCFHQPKRLFYRIFFNIEIIKILKPFNFSPPPKIDCALLRIRERSVSKDWLKWKESLIIFLNRVLSKPEARLEKLLCKLFRKHQIEYILTKYNIPNEQKAKDVPIKYWESIFHEWCRYKKMN
ncbi:MAG: hypothetical protein JJT78_18050, partial [Leptospira sp.]|nr:hypothetical protein [Leptospira sp.]